jgi:hypothetical protein
MLEPWWWIRKAETGLALWHFDPDLQPETTYFCNQSISHLFATIYINQLPSLAITSMNYFHQSYHFASIPSFTIISISHLPSFPSSIWFKVYPIRYI